MLIAVIFSFLLEHNQQIIYFCSFITKPLLTDFFYPSEIKSLEAFFRMGGGGGGGVFVSTGDSLSFHLQHAGH